MALRAKGSVFKVEGDLHFHVFTHGAFPIHISRLHRLRVEHAAELDQAIKDALAYDGPALVKIMSDAELI